MKAITRLVAGCMACAVATAGYPASAHPVQWTTGWSVSAWSIGQAEPTADAMRRQQAELLDRARDAMRRGSLDEADQFLRRAEALDVEHEKLFSMFVETPERVRSDLDRLRKQQEPQGPRPSSQFSPIHPGGAHLPPQDPFRAPGASAQPAATGTTPLPYSASPGAGPHPSDITKSDLQRLPLVPGDRVRASLSDLGPQGPTTAAQQHSLPPSNIPAAKQEVLRLLARAQFALEKGDVRAAHQLAQQAAAIPVPDTAFLGNEPRPWEVLLQVQQALSRHGSGVVPATNLEEIPAAGSAASYPVSQGVYRPGSDMTRTELAQSQESALSPAPSPGARMYERGLQALEAGDRSTALQLFLQAWRYEDQLDALTRQELKNKLSQLNTPSPNGLSIQEPSRLQALDTQQEVLRQKLWQEITSAEAEAQQMMTTNPRGALEHLQRVRDRVAQSDLDPAVRKPLLTLADQQVGKLRAFIDQHREQIELDERNRSVLEEIDRDRAVTVEIQDKVADLVERFNTLMEEERFAEADVVAKQVRELAPESGIAKTLMINSRFRWRIQEQQRIDEQASANFASALQSVDDARVPFDDRQPLVFGDARRWAELTSSRQELERTRRNRLSIEEQKIQESLKTKVEVRFSNVPLTEVLSTLGSMAGISIYPDVEGMLAEGVSTETPVNIVLTQPISLKSALHLILEPLRLSYVIQHEVLRITSEQARDAHVYAETYNVADLVIPIPNFTPGYNVGLPAAIREAHRALGYGGGVVQPVSMAPMAFAGGQDTSLNPNVLAQPSAYGGMMQSGPRPAPLPGFGSPGGAALADFDSLIELITSTIAPETWDVVGGPGAIEAYENNLSLVISQTQEVHDQIADLLEQLRRLQDLQVTIEVRFITLQDNFFERIGIDFDFDVDDNVLALPFDDSGPTVAVGLDATGVTNDLDFQFNQDSFSVTAPAFGGFQPASAARFGFAILSDIEAFFLVEAAQGDNRSNVLQAPKVTMFNGEVASVNDTSQRPFVTSLIPVVGDFAAAQQPVIVVLNEGTSLTVQAVVSSDRRFVRLTLQPVFSQIGNVDTFTFQGTTTTNTGTNVVDADGNPTGDVDEEVTTTEGTTVQLPTFSFTTVSTTVSVPDGGTILLGGIKRLREGRNEQGVPMLNKLPYVNRLFKNVGIGRETQSLMLMVTPRIIIQEEEEERMGLIQ